jgi:enamine deaminase RidA (YjgF/YER057c/UK114 family)
MTGRQLVASGSPFENAFGFSRVVRIGQQVVVAGTAPVWPDGSCPPDTGVLARRCFEIIAEALAKAGASLADVVRCRVFVIDSSDAGAAGQLPTTELITPRRSRLRQFLNTLRFPNSTAALSALAGTALLLSSGREKSVVTVL